MQKASFKDVKVLDLFESGYKSMITVNKNTTVHETLKILYDTGILSVPVADQNIHVYPKHIAGFIDLLDILAYLIHVCEAYSLSYSVPSALATHFLSKQVGELIDYSSRDKFKTVLEEDDLLSVMGVLGQGSHRVAVVNVLSDIQNLIAQSDVVQLISANVQLLGQYADVPVQNLGFMKQLVLVNASEPALSAFKRMNDMRVSAAPMVDDSGKYVGTLSVSDLKGLNAESFEFLKGTAQAFSEKHHYLLNVPLACSPSDSLRKVIADLVQTQCRKHRIWIIDSEQKPMSDQTTEDPLRQEKVKLRELLNETHTFRLSLRGTHPTTEQVEKLRSLAEHCLTSSNTLNMEHGKALSLEMLFTAKLIALELRGREVPSKEFFDLEADLLEAEKIARSYNDKHLVTRILEGLANIYRRTDQYEKEINTIDRAISIERTVPKTVALLDAYHRVLNYLYEKQPTHTDAIVKANTDYWGNYLWVKTQPEFNRDQFIMQKKVLLYKIAIYVGSLAGNPLNVGEQNPDDYKIAQEAYDEAIHIAELLNNFELLCAAHAHKSLTMLPRLNLEQKHQLLRQLKSIEETYHPENEELREMIAMIEKQFADPQQEDVAGR